MITELVNKISLLEVVLKKRNNKSYSFFEKLLSTINAGLVDDAVESILSGYAIVQYADFNYKEEVLFEEIWNIADNFKNSKETIF